MTTAKLNTIRVRRLTERVDRLRSRAVPALTPLYRRHPRGHPEPIGTGITIALDREVVVISAAHVSDYAVRSRLHMGVGTDVLPIEGQRWTSPVPPNGEREEDRTDLAFWRLQKDFAARIPAREILPESLLDVHHSTPPFRGDDDHFVILGYPVTKQPRQPADGELRAVPMTFIARSLVPSEYRTTRRNPAESLLLEYDKDDSFSLKGRSVGPDLPGLSGGAVWHYPHLLSGQRGRPLLAAIAIRWRTTEPKCIISTRLGPLVAAVRESRSG